MPTAPAARRRRPAASSARSRHVRRVGELEGVDAIALKPVPGPASSTGQAHLDVYGAGIVAEPEVRAKIVLREKAPARSNLANLPAVRGHRHLRPDGESIARR